MVTWGDSRFGGDASPVLPKLGKDVVEITGSGKALAARTAEGRVYSWGSEDCGGDCSEVEDGWTVMDGDRYPPEKNPVDHCSLFNGHMIHPIFRLMFGCFGGLGLIFFGGEDSDDGMMLFNRVDCCWVVVFFFFRLFIWWVGVCFEAIENVE